MRNAGLFLGIFTAAVFAQERPRAVPPFVRPAPRPAAAPAHVVPPPGADTLDVSRLTFRLGRPLITRGPSWDEMDNAFNQIKLNNGQYRGFCANGTSYAIDGPDPWSMGWPRTAVLSPGPAATFSSCGQWLNSTEKQPGTATIHGFIHWETWCNYGEGQTHKSMAFASSTDEGRTWSAPRQIISGSDCPALRTITGEGDCTVVNGKDGFYYAYCLRNRDWETIVARASVSNPEPGSWKKFYDGSWSQPGLGGDAAPLGFIGMGAGRQTRDNTILILGVDPWFGGLKVSLSGNRTTFTTLSEPLIPLDGDQWTRPPDAGELVAYPSVVNPDDGSNQIGDHFLLVHMYLQPGEGFDQRYLVFRDVTTSTTASPVVPQIGIALTRWHNVAAKDRWTTTAPVPGNYHSYAYDIFLGYLMTRAHPTLPTEKLEDCVSYWPGHPDHLLTNGSCDKGYRRLRTAGWVYQAPQPNTLPIYRCYSEQDRSHFAANKENCDGLGQKEWLLGYALAN